MRAAAISILFFLPAIHAQDEIKTIAEIKQAFCKHRFDPSIMAPFDRREVDPLIVEFEWSSVRKEIEAVLKPLNVGRREISLPIRFRPLDKNWLIPVFVFEKGNNRAKALFKEALKLRDGAIWDYEPALGVRNVEQEVAETLAAYLKHFKPEYRKGAGLNLVQVHIGLQNLIRDHPTLKPLGFQPLPLTKIQDKALYFATTWKSWRENRECRVCVAI